MPNRGKKYANADRVTVHIDSYADGGLAGAKQADEALRKAKEATMKKREMAKPEKGKKPKRIGKKPKMYY